MLENGTVIEIVKDGKPHLWKILGVFKSIGRETKSYSVIRCSKNGKEYRDRNGYSVDWVDKEVKSGWVKVVATAPVGEKADIADGILTGKSKRRIAFLKARIEQDQKEIAKLEKIVS